MGIAPRIHRFVLFVLHAASLTHTFVKITPFIQSHLESGSKPRDFSAKKTPVLFSSSFCVVPGGPKTGAQIDGF